MFLISIATSFLYRHRIALALFSLFTLLTLFWMMPTNFVSADLGRHLMNGRVFLSGGGIPQSNYYSYTMADFPFTNHHWASGVLFEWIRSFSGFAGLSIFYVLLNVATCGLFLHLARLQYADKGQAPRWLPLLVIGVLIPLLAYRTDIRPEGLSYFFLALMWWLLDRLPHLPRRVWSLVGVAVVQVLWVNSHIFFAMGILMTAGWVLAQCCRYARLPKWWEVFTFLIVVTASFLNPLGLRGVVEPFSIFNDYGYMIAENMPIFFMLSRHFTLLLVYAATMMVTGVLLLPFLRRHWRSHFFLIGMWLAGLALAMMMIRGISLFALISIPFLTMGLSALASPGRRRVAVLHYIPALFLLGVLGFSLWTDSPRFNIQQRRVAVGLYPQVHQAAHFFKSLELFGPVFNNYDVGGYLIYHLFPQERVFVDNRPEAYSTSFFQEVLVPMQSNEAIWEAALADYGFKVIFFDRRDATPWAQPFLLRRIRDPRWVPVYVDTYTLILLDRQEAAFQPVIDRYALPGSMFSER